MDKSFCGHVDKFANNTNKLGMAYVDTVYNLVDKLKKEVCDCLIQSQTLAYLQGVREENITRTYLDLIIMCSSLCCS